MPIFVLFLILLYILFGAAMVSAYTKQFNNLTTYRLPTPWHDFAKAMCLAYALMGVYLILYALDLLKSYQ